MNVNDATSIALRTCPEAILVSSLGTATSAARLASNDGAHFYLGASMGSALACALGLAEALPQHSVIALLGDGELLMGASSLWSLSAIRPANLTVVVLADGAYSITGGQPIPASLRFADVVEAMEGLHGVAVDDGEALEAALVTQRQLDGPLVIEARLSERIWPGPSPFVDPTATVHRLRTAVGSSRDVSEVVS